MGEVGVWVGIIEEDRWQGEPFAFFCSKDFAAGSGKERSICDWKPEWIRW